MLTAVGFHFAWAPGLHWYNRFGDYSYGIYLYGWPAQQLALMAFPDSSNALNTLLGCLIALAVAVPSWHLIERPAMRLKERVVPARRGHAAGRPAGAVAE